MRTGPTAADQPIAAEPGHTAGGAAGARLVLLWLSGMGLRVTLLVIPPVLPLIHRDLGLDEKGVAALTSLPVLLLGLAAVPGSLVIARFGARRTLIGGLVAIGISSSLRGIGASIPVLFAATFIMGAGVAMIQPTLPALVRQWYPGAITRATGVWSNGLLVGELLGAALMLPLVMPLVGGSWERALAIWGVPVLITAVLVAVGTRHSASEAASLRGSGLPDWTSRQMWLLGLLQAASGLIYWSANTFIPDYLTSIGQAALVGTALAVLNGFQVPASFVIGLIPWRVLGHPVTSIVVAVTIVLGLGAMLAPSPLLVVVAAAIFGFCAAYILVLSFALPALVAAPRDVSRLAAGMFTTSYTLSFLANLATGAVWDATHVAASAFIPIVCGAVIVGGLGPRLVGATARSAPSRPV